MATGHAGAKRTRESSLRSVGTRAGERARPTSCRQTIGPSGSRMAARPARTQGLDPVNGGASTAATSTLRMPTLTIPAAGPSHRWLAPVPIK